MILQAPSQRAVLVLDLFALGTDQRRTRPCDGRIERNLLVCEVEVELLESLGELQELSHLCRVLQLLELFSETRWAQLLGLFSEAVMDPTCDHETHTISGGGALCEGREKKEARAMYVTRRPHRGPVRCQRNAC